MKIPKKIIVFRTRCDFFFGLRFAIVHPLAIQDNKKRPRLAELEEARQSPNNSNKPGRKNTVRADALLFDKTGGFF